MRVNKECPSLINKKFPLDLSNEKVPILVVEDDPDFLDLLSMEISQITGTRLTVANSCEAAVDKLIHGKFQLVVCDWALASRTGPEVFLLADPLMMLDRSAKIPVMFMSGSEKVGPTHNLRSLKHFEPVTFILKDLGAAMIRIMAENILQRFNQHHQDEAPYAYLS